nr:His/Gly/Thr/Pro-type tRNA ligase C-terminal domain-containing protein [Calothrix sp. PCC 6303]
MKLCVIIGSEEAPVNKAMLKDLKSREQVEVLIDDLAGEIQSIL